MKTTHTIDAHSVTYGDPDKGAEVDLRIKFTFLHGASEQGPSYASGGQLADPDEVEVVSCVQLVGDKEIGGSDRYMQDWLDEMGQNWLENEGANKVRELVNA